MVNIRAIANRATRAVNPNLSVGWRQYQSYVTTPNGKTAPTWAAAVPLICQVQALSKSDILHLDSLNITTCDRAVYANVQLGAIDRVEQIGGDLLVFEDGVWLVTAILEGWTTAGWSRAALTKQTDAPV